MEPEGAVLPEFDPLRRKGKAGPVGRARDRAGCIGLRIAGDPLFERRSIFHRTGLFGGPGTDPALPGPALEVGVRLLRRHGMDRTFYPHLAAQRLPVEDRKSTRLNSSHVAIS